MNPIQAGEDLLPTIGNVAGSMFGGAVGGGTGLAAGAAVPGADLTGVPEAAGGIAGGTIGAGIGGGLGQEAGAAAKGFLQHTGQDAGSVLSNIAGGGVSGALGHGIGELGSSLLGGIAKKAAAPAMSAADQALKSVTDYAKPLADKLAGYVRGTTTKINNNFMADNTGSVMGSVAKKMQDLGVAADPNEWRKAGSLATKYLNGEMQKILQGTPEISGELKRQIGIALANGKIPADAVQGGGGVNLGGAKLNVYSPQGLFKVIQELESRGHAVGASSNVTMTPQQVLDQKGMLDTAKSLKNMLFKDAGVNATASQHVVDPKVLAALDKEGKDMPGVANYVKTELQKLSSSNNPGNDLRAAQAPMVQADNIGKEVIQRLKGGAEVPVDQPHSLEEAAQALLGGVTSPVKTAVNLGSKLAGGVMPAISKGAGMLSKLPIGPAATGAMSLGGAALAAKPTAPGGAPPGGQLTGNAQPQGAGGPMNPLQNAYQEDQGAQNALAMQAFKAGPAMGGSFAGPEASLGASMGQLAPQLQQQQAASQMLQGLPGAYQQAPTGLMGAIQGMIPGTAASNYQQQSRLAAAAIAKLMGITPEQAQGLLPQLINPAAAPGREAMTGGAGAGPGILGSFGAGQ